MEEIRHSSDSTFDGCGCGCGCPSSNKDFNKQSANSHARQNNKCTCICTGDYSDNHANNAKTGITL
jgi:hypothetical protein